MAGFLSVAKESELKDPVVSPASSPMWVGLLSVTSPPALPAPGRVFLCGGGEVPKMHPWTLWYGFEADTPDFRGHNSWSEARQSSGAPERRVRREWIRDLVREQFSDALAKDGLFWIDAGTVS